MKAAIVIPPKDFRDETLRDVKLILGKWGVDVDVTSYSKSNCVGTHGAVVTPDLNTNKVHSDDYDAIIFIDGAGVESYRLYDFRPLLDMTRAFNGKGKIVAGIGNGVKIIARTNIVNGVKIAMPPDRDTADTVVLYRGTITRREIMSDKKIITARSSENVVDFVNSILEAAGVR